MSDQEIQKKSFIKMVHTSPVTNGEPLQYTRWINPQHVIQVSHVIGRDKSKITFVALFANEDLNVAGHVGSDVARMLNEHLDPTVACKCCNEPEEGPSEDEEAE